MAKEVISLRLERQLKLQFEQRLKQDDIGQAEKLIELITMYVEQPLGTGQPVIAGTVQEFLTEHGLREDCFTLTHRPMEYFSETMDFAWMFAGDDLQNYYIESGEINANGWFLNHWLWVFLWSWMTVFGVTKHVPTDRLVQKWYSADDPVTSVVGLGSGDVQYSSNVRALVKEYTTDKEKVQRW